MHACIPNSTSDPFTYPQNVDDCVCDPGFNRSGDACRPGAPPFYWVGGNAQQCAENKETRAALASSSEDCGCVEGFYAAAGWREVCVACGASTYNPQWNSTICLNCPDFSGHHLSGSTNIVDCQCDPGHTGPDGGPCVACPGGFYKSGRGLGSEAFELDWTTPGTTNSEYLNKLTYDAEWSELQGWVDENVVGNAAALAACDLASVSSYTALFGILSQHPCANRGSDYTSSSFGAMLECIWTVGTIGGESQVFALQKLYIGPGHSSNGIKVLFFVGDSDAQILAKVQDGTCWLDGSAKQSSYPSGSSVEISWGSASTGSCVACPPGQYSNGTGASQCVDCHVHSTSPANATFLSECRCEPGFEPDGPNVCRACAPGTFKNTTENTACRPCPAGQFQAAGGATGCEACAADAQPVLAATVCQCNAGFTLDASASAHACVACGVGAYKTAVGDEACTDCPDEQHTSALASTAISACFCVEGFEGDFYSCAACAAGTYKDFVYWTQGSGSCLACPDNTDSPVASTALTNCTCLAGFAADHDGVTCVECGLGEFKSTTGTGQCEACAENTFQNETGQTACYACMARSTTEGLVGQDSVADCICRDGSVRQGTADNPYCTECQPGEFAVPGQGCQSCPATSYTTEYGSTECIPCLPNSVANETRTGCVCNAGFTCHEKRCAGADITKRCSSVATCPHVAARFPLQGSWKEYHAIDGSTSTIYQNDWNYYTSAQNSNQLPLWWRYDLGEETGISKLRHQTYQERDQYAMNQRAWRIRLGNSSDFDSPENYDIDTRFPDGAVVDVWLNDVVTRYIFIWKPAQYAEGDDGYVWFTIAELSIYGVCPRLCPDGNCTACAANHYKETVSWERCTACQADAQSPVASTQESDCKCNRGFIQDGASVCVACEAGTYSDSYDAGGLDASACAACPQYTRTEPVPADGPEDCHECTLCGADEYWDAGCRMPDNNTDATCAECSDSLSVTTAASRDAMPDSLNEGEDSCECRPGAFFNALEYYDGVMDYTKNLAVSCGANENEICAAQYETGSWNTNMPASNLLQDVSLVIRTNQNTASVQTVVVDLGREQDVSELKLFIYDYAVNGALCTFGPANCLGACGTYFEFQTDDPNSVPAPILDEDGNTVRLRDELCTANENLHRANPDEEVDLERHSLNSHNLIASAIVRASGMTEFSFYFPKVTMRYLRLNVLSEEQYGAVIHQYWKNVPSEYVNNARHWAAIYKLEAFAFRERQASCDYCPEGQFKEIAGQQECTACPHGSSTLPCYNATHNCDAYADCICLPGFGGRGGSLCAECAVGFAKNDIGNANCTACKPNENSWDASGQNVTTGVLYCACNPGFYRLFTANSQCVPCLPGTFKDKGGHEVCTACVAGTYQDEFQAADCKTCPANSDSSEGLRHCICNAGFQNSNGTHYQSDGTACQACSAGKVKTAASTASCQTCARCGADERVLRPCNATHDTLCQPCQANSNSPAGNLLQHCYCDSGYEFVGGECQACAVGKAKAGDSNNSVVCQTCAPGTFADFTGSAVCSTCNTYCPTGEFVSSECVPGSDIACANCTRCAPGFYGNPVCGPLFGENRLDTNCSRCLVDHYCRDDALTACPVNAHSPAGSAAVEDCVCRKGMYEAADGTCAECGLDFYCYRDARTACPAHSVTLSTFADHVLDCNCRQGYYREWHDDTYTNFSCLVCRENDYCFNNSAFNCSDDRMVSAEQSDSIADCVCVSGFYNSEDNTKCHECPPDAYCANGGLFNCSADRWTAGLSRQTDADACMCRPGSFGAEANETHSPACALCPLNSYCEGDNLRHACPANSITFLAGQSSRTACLCGAGYAATAEVEHQCVLCAAETFKTEVLNGNCTACTQCRAAEGEFEAVVCSNRSDTLCSPCTACVPGVSFVAVPCSDYHDTQCQNCTKCDYETQFRQEDCSVLSDTVCPVFEQAQCPEAGFYRGQHTETTDSLCAPCLSRDTPYFGQTLHTFTTPGLRYNDAYSCQVQCLGHSRLRDPANHSLGCVSCESGSNVLFRQFSSNGTHCSFQCREGYVLDLARQDCVPSAAQHELSLILDVVDVNVTSDEVRVRVFHSNHSRFAVLAGNASTSNCARSACCYRHMFRVSTLAQLGRSGAENCSRGGAYGQQVDEQRLDVVLSHTQLEEVAACERTVSGEVVCRLHLAIVDALRRNWLDREVVVSVRRTASLVAVGAHSELIPLSAVQVIVLPVLALGNGDVILAVLVSVEGGAQDLNMDVRLRDGNPYALSDAEVEKCARLHFNVNETTSMHISAGADNSALSFWQARLEVATVFMTLSGQGEQVMDIAAVRNVSGLPFACHDTPPLVAVEAGTVFASAGLGKDTVYARQRLHNAMQAMQASHGELGTLITFIALSQTSTMNTVTLSSLLAAYTKPGPTQVATADAVQSHNGTLTFNHTFTRACLASPDCQYEYFWTQAGDPAVHLVQDCSASAVAAAQAWIRTSFGVPHDDGHVQAVCEVLNAHPQKGLGVLVHTLRYVRARGPGWDVFHNSSLLPSHSHVWAAFVFRR